MKQVNSKPVDRKSFYCPQCSKPRMIRDMEHTVSTEKNAYKTKDNKEIDLHVDICEPCKQRNFKKYFEPSRADVRKVLKAMQDEAAIGEDESLEELL